MRWFVCILWLSVLCVAAPAVGRAQDGIVAVVNKDVITAKELRDFENFLRMQMERELKGKALEEKLEGMLPNLLDKLIDDRIILQEAERSGVKANEERVKLRMQEIRKRYASEFEFKEDLKRQGFVPADIERKIREQFITYAIIEDRVRSKVVVKPEEVTAYYRSHAWEYNKEEERIFETVAADADETVRAARHDLVRGLSLDVVCQRYGVTSDELSVFKGRGLKPELEAVLFSLPEGGVSDVIRSGDSYYIFRVKNIVPRSAMGLQEVQDQIYAAVYQQKVEEKLASWLKDLKDKAYIKILQ